MTNQKHEIDTNPPMIPTFRLMKDKELSLLDARFYLFHELKTLFYSLKGNGAGGALHIVLDDCNMDDGSIAFCRLQLTLAENIRDRELGIAILDLLMTLSHAQRLGFWHYEEIENILIMKDMDIADLEDKNGNYLGVPKERCQYCGVPTVSYTCDAKLCQNRIGVLKQ